MKNKLIFGVAIAGFIAGLVAAYIFAMRKPPLPPAFKPAENPYPNGIYSEGIIESALHGVGSADEDRRSVVRRSRTGVGPLLLWSCQALSSSVIPTGLVSR